MISLLSAAGVGIPLGGTGGCLSVIFMARSIGGTTASVCGLRHILCTLQLGATLGQFAAFTHREFAQPYISAVSAGFDRIDERQHPGIQPGLDGPQVAAWGPALFVVFIMGASIHGN